MVTAGPAVCRTGRPAFPSSGGADRPGQEVDVVSQPPWVVGNSWRTLGSPIAIMVAPRRQRLEDHGQEDRRQDEPGGPALAGGGRPLGSCGVVPSLEPSDGKGEAARGAARAAACWVSVDVQGAASRRDAVTCPPCPGCRAGDSARRPAAHVEGATLARERWHPETTDRDAATRPAPSADRRRGRHGHAGSVRFDGAEPPPLVPSNGIPGGLPDMLGGQSSAVLNSSGLRMAVARHRSRGTRSPGCDC